jgi:tRNA 2-selenouridine synthase
MAERVLMWHREYPHFGKDPVALVEKLSYLKSLVGGTTVAKWKELAERGDIDALFESIMVDHYDPAYTRSTNKNYGKLGEITAIHLDTLDSSYLAGVAAKLTLDDDMLPAPALR